MSYKGLIAVGRAYQVSRLLNV